MMNELPGPSFVVLMESCSLFVVKVGDAALAGSPRFWRLVGLVTVSLVGYANLKISWTSLADSFSILIACSWSLCLYLLD